MSEIEIDQARRDVMESIIEANARVQDFIIDYVADYEFRGESDHMPNDDERALLMDAIQGLISDDDFLIGLARCVELRNLLLKL
jgi:hypothetical protein